MAMNKSQTDFLYAFEARLKTANAAMFGGNIWNVGNWFTGVLRDMITNLGFSGMTKEEFLEVVGKSVDMMAAAFGLNPMMVALIKAMALTIAGRLYDKRNPKPA